MPLKSLTKSGINLIERILAWASLHCLFYSRVLMKPLTGCLRNPIDPTAAPARGLARSLGLPPDANDVRSYARSELKVRFAALDEFFGLDSNAQDIWQQRAKALVARKYNIDP